jgi:hypothetical protein
MLLFHRERSKGTEYTENLTLIIEKSTSKSKKIILLQEHITCQVKVEVPFLHKLHKIINLEKGTQLSIIIIFQKGARYQNFFTGSVGADLPKNRVIRFDGSDILANHYCVQHEREIFKVMCIISKWLPVKPNKRMCIFKCLHFQFL